MAGRQINQVAISDEQLERIAGRLKSHTCQFDDIEAKRIHRFADMMTDDGLDNVREVIAFGAWIKASKKTGNAVLIACLVSAVIGAMWLGVVKIIKNG